VSKISNKNNISIFPPSRQSKMQKYEILFFHFPAKITQPRKRINWIFSFTSRLGFLAHEKD